MVMLVCFRKGFDALGDGVGLEYVYRGGAIGGVPCKETADKLVQFRGVFAPNSAAVGHQQRSALFYIGNKSILDGGGFPWGAVCLGLVVALAHDDHGVIRQLCGVKIGGVIHDINVETVAF
jgi:hypothetical protein